MLVALTIYVNMVQVIMGVYLVYLVVEIAQIVLQEMINVMEILNSVRIGMNVILDEVLSLELKLVSQISEIMGEQISEMLTKV